MYAKAFSQRARFALSRSFSPPAYRRRWRKIACKTGNRPGTNRAAERAPCPVAVREPFHRRILLLTQRIEPQHGVIRALLRASGMNCVRIGSAIGSCQSIRASSTAKCATASAPASSPGPNPRKTSPAPNPESLAQLPDVGDRVFLLKGVCLEFFPAPPLGRPGRRARTHRGENRGARPGDRGWAALRRELQG